MMFDDPNETTTFRIDPSSCVLSTFVALIHRFPCRNAVFAERFVFAFRIIYTLGVNYTVIKSQCIHKTLLVSVCVWCVCLCRFYTIRPDCVTCSRSRKCDSELEHNNLIELRYLLAMINGCMCTWHFFHPSHSLCSFAALCILHIT